VRDLDPAREGCWIAEKHHSEAAPPLCGPAAGWALRLRASSAAGEGSVGPANGNARIERTMPCRSIASRLECRRGRTS
jgi:hypothetical protein